MRTRGCSSNGTKVPCRSSLSGAGDHQREFSVPIRFVNTNGLADVAHGLMIAGLIILFLYVAGSIVEPLAIAALLSFILAPVMRRLRGWGTPKVVAALLSV